MSKKEKRLDLLLKIKHEKSPGNKTSERILTAVRDLFFGDEISLTGNVYQLCNERHRARRLLNDIERIGALLESYGGDVDSRFAAIQSITTKRQIKPEVIKAVAIVVNSGASQYSAANAVGTNMQNVKTAYQKLQYFDAVAAEYKKLL